MNKGSGNGYGNGGKRTNVRMNLRTIPRAEVEAVAKVRAI
jgi:hypothetical protein